MNSLKALSSLFESFTQFIFGQLTQSKHYIPMQKRQKFVVIGKIESISDSGATIETEKTKHTVRLLL